MKDKRDKFVNLVLIRRTKHPKITDIDNSSLHKEPEIRQVE